MSTEEIQQIDMSQFNKPLNRGVNNVYVVRFLDDTGEEEVVRSFAVIKQPIEGTVLLSFKGFEVSDDIDRNLINNREKAMEFVETKQVSFRDLQIPYGRVVSVEKL